MWLAPYRLTLEAGLRTGVHVLPYVLFLCTDCYCWHGKEEIAEVSAVVLSPGACQVALRNSVVALAVVPQYVL